MKTNFIFSSFVSQRKVLVWFVWFALVWFCWGEVMMVVAYRNSRKKTNHGAEMCLKQANSPTRGSSKIPLTFAKLFDLI